MVPDLSMKVGTYTCERTLVCEPLSKLQRESFSSSTLEFHLSGLIHKFFNLPFGFSRPTNIRSVKKSCENENN